MLSGQYVAPAAASAAAAKTTLRVLSLNTWGLNWPFSEDKWYRVRALRNAIALNDYDVILLQEVWFRRDYDIIRSAVPYASYFESFNQCSGYFLPMECSGLVILSRHRIEHVEFLPFRDGIGRNGIKTITCTYSKQLKSKDDFKYSNIRIIRAFFSSVQLLFEFN